MARIFISYKRIDKEKVFPLKHRIEVAINENCWIDLEGIESDAQFKNVIIRAINESEIFLFMYSKAHSKIEDYEKDWTVRELDFAALKGKRIVFLNIDGTPLTDMFLFDYSSKQQVDATSDEALDRLFSDLNKWLGSCNQQHYVNIEEQKQFKVELNSIKEEHEEEDLNELSLVPYISNGKIGFVDEQSMQIVIACIYEEAFPFVDGLARIRLNGKFGFIDKKGKQIIPCNYLSAFDFCEGLAAVYQYEGWGFVDIKGREIIKCQYESVGDFCEGYACVKYKGVKEYNGKWECLNNSYGYINQYGHEAFPAKFSNAHSFHDGLALVEIDNGNVYEPAKKYFFIDRWGDIIIECKYDYVDSFYDGFACVGLKDSCGNLKIGYIGKSGRELIGRLYDYDYESAGSIHRFSEGLACVKINGKYGYIDQNGELIIPCEYDFALPFKYGLACVALNGTEGCLDESGKVVVSFGYYDRIIWLDEDWAAVQFKSKWGFVNNIKDVVTPFVYDEIVMEGKGIVKVKFNGKYGFVDLFGNDTFE